MILAVGLGNPGPRYEWTRHNVGAWAARRAAAAAGAGPFRARFSGLLAEGRIGDEPVAYLLPQTFMNASGQSVREAVEVLGVDVGQLVVLHDELDLPAGVVRLKQGGGEAGHRGLRSVSEQLGTRDYVRVRIGIGRPDPAFEGDVADFVLEAVPSAERARLLVSADRAAEAVSSIALSGVASAMNEINQRDSSR
ncbi:MAG: aminoacyl-tRNA hydrolase [Polyangiaceae bacterium]|nr:aminoacyl-tRNA hydrolase [Polyangiaceae bacterium]